MPVTKRRPGQNKKTYFTPDEITAIRAWLTILMAQADLAREKALRLNPDIPEIGAAGSVAHWDGWIACLKAQYHRVECGTKWKVFDAAVRLVLDLPTPGAQLGE